MPNRACLPVIERQLDSGRLVLPAALRECMGPCVELSADPSGCVLITPPGLWREMLPMLLECGGANHYAIELFRFHSAGETCANVDERGRVTLPPLHLEWAGLDAGGAAIVVALGRAAQVWHPRRLTRRLRVANRRLRSLKSHVLREQLSLLEP